AGTPYVAQCVVMIEGPLDRRTLKESLLRVVEQNEILRTNFRHWKEMNVPVQTISPAQIAWAGECDLRGLGTQEQELELQRLIEASRQTPFNLEHGSVFQAQLVQLSFWEHQLILTLPALCADRQTLSNLVQRLSSYHHDVERSGEQPLQYADVSQWYYDALESEDAQAGREYWRNQYVAGADSVVLPFEKRVASENDFRPQVFTMKMSGELSRRIATCERRGETPLPALFLSCWQILLWRLTKQSQLQIGLACNGRNYPELEQAFGLLTTNVPIVSRIDAETTSQQIFQRAVAALNEAQEWQDCFTWGSASKSDSSLSFFPVCFEFNERPAESFTNGIKFSIHRQYTCVDRFKVKLSCIRADHSYVTEFHYDSELFDAEGIQCLASRFQTLLAGMLAQPDGAAGTWEILGESERQSQAAYNATAHEFPACQSFQQLFELQVERTPNALALVYGDEQFSYAQLNAAANNVAHHLLRYGIGRENTVALCLERSPLMLIALLGTLKTGAAYLPLDVQAPARRLWFILQDAEVSAVITQNQFRGSFREETEFPIWCLDTEVLPDNGDRPENPPVVAHPENLAYVIYTSGSTGNPKGVMIENRGLINYLSWARTAYRMGEGSRTLVHSPFSFDLTITGLLLPLIAGGTVELVSQGDELERLCDALADPEQHYALIKLTPSHLQVLSSWLGERTRSGRVDALIIGGEALSADLLTVWQQQSPETRLINEYGPTETVVGCSTYEVSTSAGNGSIAIGRPLVNMQMYVLDEAMHQVPAGVIGEIYIGGEQVARGYLNQTALTAERFVPNPFSTEPGKRLYRSGDLGRMRADGEMEYLGRADEQVKIKGFRIELGEVETVLRQHELVRECVVVVHGTGEEKRLLAYVVPGEENGDGRELKQQMKEEIRSYLRRELPEYMVPRDIVVLDRMRLTPNGKIDRKALPLPSREPRAEDDSFDEQLSPAARAMSRIWCEFLNLEHVGVNDNFFGLGGDSILAVQIAFKAKQLGLTFHPIQLFRHPTIAQLETVIAASSNEQLFVVSQS
ncbi:MAG TPA: amino acid adenylation domain-containing protein, partial [Pyrinomonadaceae bacterium]|nr:amino acid adenylation domain-containing protein [Pyrinomonadaceae bacterium]